MKPTAFAGLLAALALLASSTQARAQPSSQPVARAAPVAELIGRDPAEVRSRLADLPAGWPIPPAFQIATPQGLLTFITAQDLMTDPALAARMAAFRTQADRPPSEPYLQCRELLTRKGGSPEPAGEVVLVFRDGRLASAFQPVPAALPPIPSPSDRKAQLAFIRRPQSSPFIARFGELPLEDQLGFLSRSPNTALAADDALSVACAPPPPPPSRPTSRKPAGLDASDMQGLALLPFAVTLPAKNRQRVAARRQGAALLAALRVGEALGSAPPRFAAGHPGVRAYPAGQGDYAVLSIDLGGYPGRNLSNFNDAALVGVRGGRIEWIAPPAGFGPHPALLCLDDHGVPNAPRPGCSGWGHFSP